MIEIFLLSLLVSVILVLGKVWELKTGKRSIFSIVLSKIDPLILKVSLFFKNFLEHNKKKAIFILLVHFPSKVESFVGNLRDKAHRKYRKSVLGVKEFEEMSDDYTPSAFMRNISQIKKGSGSVDE